MSNCTLAANATAAATPGPYDEVMVFVQNFVPFASIFIKLPDWMKLAVIGAILETSRRYLFSFWDTIKSSFFLNAHFDNGDNSFDWMMAWIATQPSFQKSRDIEVSTSGVGNSGTFIPGEERDADNEDDKPLKYVPSNHTMYSLWYKGRWMQVMKVRSDTSGDYWRKTEERLHVSILTRDRKMLNSLLLDAKKAWKAGQKDEVRVWVSDLTNDWNLVASRPKRPMSSIILDPTIKNLVLEDARDFLSSKKWYATRGIPFRRGYLLYGPPGTGKTSLIHSIAGELGLDVYIISLSRLGLDDTSLSTMISQLPTRCIALMEDVDAAFRRGITREADASEKTPDGKAEGAPETSKPAEPPRQGPQDTPASRVTLSGLLNALDGIGAQEGRILFATTNRYAALDSALTRPGRMDLHIEFCNSTPYQAEELFRCFFLPENDAEATVETSAMNESEDEAAEDEKSALIDLSEPTSQVFVFPPTPSTSTSTSSSTPSSPTATCVSLPSPLTPTSPSFKGVAHSARAPRLSRRQYQKLARQFANAIPDGEFSMASLQGYLMTYKIRPADAVRDVHGWIQQQREERAKKAAPSS